MKDSHRYNYHDRIIDEAADWFTRLQDTDLSCEDREAFADWLSASSEHVREYLALTNLHTDINELPSSRSVGDLIDVARQAQAENVISLYEQEAPTPAGFSSGDSGLADSPENRGANAGTGRVKRFSALAASVAIVTLVCVWWLYPSENAATYATSVGEQKSFPLPDGSLVTLNTVSKIQIRYTERYRDVQLLSGEALFTVAKNRQRPFRVLANDSVIQAVGTQFNVYHRRADTTVTVVEGTVEIRAAALRDNMDAISLGPRPPSPSAGTGLGARSNDEEGSVRKSAAEAPQVGGSAEVIHITKGQSAHIGAQDAPITVSAVDVAVETAWRERRLTFESRPLGAVVAEFNLYNKLPIEIRDAALNALQVSGSFNANDPQSFALFLEEAKLAKPRLESGKILLMPLATQ